MWPFNKKKAAEPELEHIEIEDLSKQIISQEMWMNNILQMTDGDTTIYNNNKETVCLILTGNQRKLLDNFSKIGMVEVINEFGERSYRMSNGKVNTKPQYDIKYEVFYPNRTYEYVSSQIHQFDMSKTTIYYLVSPAEYARVRADLKTAEAMANNWKAI